MIASTNINLTGAPLTALTKNARPTLKFSTRISKTDTHVYSCVYVSMSHEEALIFHRFNYWMSTF